MKRAIAASFATTAVVLTATATQAPVAQAACSAYGAKTSTSTTAYVGSCDKVQARHDRYRQYAPTAYYGSWSTSKSYVSATGGTDSGHALRAGNADGSYVQPWQWF